MNRHCSALTAGQAGDRHLVDRGVGLAHADEAGVDDELEDLVDGKHRAPKRFPLANVVGQQGHPRPLRLISRSSSIIVSVRSSASK